MIYDSEKHIDERLKEFTESDPTYDANYTFRSGYDSAWDIATCFNEKTIWNNSCTVVPDDDRDVLVAYTVGKMAVAWHNDDGWHEQGTVHRLPYDVIAWAELPDFPVELCGGDDSVG